MTLSTHRSTAPLARIALVFGLGLGCAPSRLPVAEVPSAAATVAASDALPQRLDDAEFWRLNTTFSEPGGYFQSDNFASNERSYPEIVNALQSGWKPGGVYIGVGPEQNFTYIAALRPRMVFLLDIRRQAIMHHLLYKALFELTPNRAGFVSMLFSKPRPRSLDNTSSVQEIWDGYWYVATDSGLFSRNLAAVRDHLTKKHGFALSADDLSSLSSVYRAFYALGPNITYNGYGQQAGGISYAQITSQADYAGIYRSFLANEDNFRFIRDLHLKNLIVPVVADFGGPSGIRAVGDYLRSRNATVTAFYVSNVESYLFRDFATAARFFANVATLPLDSMSTFIRPGGGGGAMRPLFIIDGRVDTSPMPPARAAPFPSAGAGTQLCPILATLRAFDEGRVRTFNDARSCRL